MSDWHSWKLVKDTERLGTIMGIFPSRKKESFNEEKAIIHMEKCGKEKTNMFFDEIIEISVRIFYSIFSQYSSCWKRKHMKYRWHCSVEFDFYSLWMNWSVQIKVLVSGISFFPDSSLTPHFSFLYDLLHLCPKRTHITICLCCGKTPGWWQTISNNCKGIPAKKANREITWLSIEHCG